MHRWLKLLGILIPLIPTIGPGRSTTAGETDPPKRAVLVELYTSQGCDMCPTAEKVLGELAERDRGIVPIAFHVDYFNEPWKDVFSDSLYSQRQSTYNEVYSKPKSAEYGLYYTPMMMVDGEQSVNGRDAAAAQSAIRRARARKPAVAIDVQLELRTDALSGAARIAVTSQSALTEKTPLLLCAVLREDGVVTHVLSGENAGKSLVARFPARETKYEFIELEGKTPVTHEFPFVIKPTWNPQKLRLAVFVQDKRTALVHQAVDVPWRATKPTSTLATTPVKSAPSTP